jgi:hypothetical protein
VGNGPLDYKYQTIFKFKRYGEKLIDGWDVKIEEFFLEDPLSVSDVARLNFKDTSYGA